MKSAYKRSYPPISRRPKIFVCQVYAPQTKILEDRTKASCDFLAKSHEKTNIAHRPRIESVGVRHASCYDDAMC